MDEPFEYDDAAVESVAAERHAHLTEEDPYRIWFARVWIGLAAVCMGLAVALARDAGANLYRYHGLLGILMLEVVILTAVAGCLYIATLVSNPNNSLVP
jgi:hypothetical protein